MANSFQRQDGVAQRVGHFLGCSPSAVMHILGTHMRAKVGIFV